MSPYLTRSPKRGTYSYRRTIPADLRAAYGKREEKVALKTSKLSEAKLAAAKINLNVEARLEVLRLAKRRGETLTEEQLVSEASAMLTRFRIHPDQAPTTSPEDLADFQIKQGEFIEDYIDSLPVNESDVEGVHTAMTSHAPLPRIFPLVKDRGSIAIEILHGKKISNSEPTLADARDIYLKVNASKKNRSPLKQSKFAGVLTRLVDALAISLGSGNKKKGLQTKIVEITRTKARDFLSLFRSENPKLAESTMGKYTSLLNAMFNSAITEFEITNKDSPFEKLRNHDHEAKRATTRRSFTPDELKAYLGLAEKLDEQAKLITLTMVYTGCRMEEATGLLVKDLSLNTEIPHIKIRANSLRGLGKRGLERSPPLVGLLLQELKRYCRPANPNDPLFPEYGRPRGVDNLSSKLNSIIRRKMKIADAGLVAYSSRHTMQDRFRAAKVDPVYADIILGHKSKASTPIAERYGTGVPPRFLHDAMTAAHTVAGWGSWEY